MKVAYKRAVAVVATAATLVVGLSTASFAGGQNYATAWETMLGAKWNGYVQIQASYNDGGRNAKQGYHRFHRAAGPSLDTGRKYTSTATSKTDKTIRSHSMWVWDSALWGDQYTTKYNWGFFYF